VMTGGLLLVLPGFITDIAGVLTVLPPTRPLVRRVLRRSGLLARRGPAGHGPVIRGEVVDPAHDTRRDDGRPRPPIPPPD
jgi:UPF0716 protein FxsA